MKIAVPKEILPQERRVALTPQVIAKLAGSGFEIFVQQGAGEGSFYSDDAYREAGAVVVNSIEELYQNSQIILKVQPPLIDEQKNINQVRQIPEGTVLISFLEAFRNPRIAVELAERSITSFSMDTIPRISRAQSMDALSSQASAAGYKAVLSAARENC